MIILRTDGGGRFHNDRRLISIRITLKTTRIYDKILKIHDHKGKLTVFWDVEPGEDEKNFIGALWAIHCEHIVEHKIAKI